MKHNKVNLGQIEAMLNRVGGMNGLKRYLALTWQIWFTIDNTTSALTPEEFCNLAKASGVNVISDEAVNVIQRMTFGTTKDKIEVVSTTARIVTDQQNGGPTKGQDTLEMAYALGLDEIPHSHIADLLKEVISRLSGCRRAGYFIAMPPVVGTDGKNNYLAIEIGDEKSNGRIRLTVGDGETPSDFLYPNYNNWLFARFEGSKSNKD